MAGETKSAGGGAERRRRWKAARTCRAVVRLLGADTEHIERRRSDAWEEGKRVVNVEAASIGTAEVAGDVCVRMAESWGRVADVFLVPSLELRKAVDKEPFL